MKALVIDDDEISRELLCSELRHAGFEVLELPSPIGATRLIHSNEIDAVVIDVVMPALRGDRLAKLLRGNPRFARLGVILVSGDTTVELQRLASTVDADAVISKKQVRGKLARVVTSAAKARVAASDGPTPDDDLPRASAATKARPKVKGFGSA